jgi:nitrogenase molybdenum-iron protein alpha chain
MIGAYDGIRENRPHSYIALCGQSDEVAQDFKKFCLKNADRTFTQGLQCQQINSIGTLLSLEDSVFIVHAPQGCAGCVSMGADRYRVGQIQRGVKLVKNPRVIVTNIDQNDVIMGAEAKLSEAIAIAVERYSPKVVFVFTSCASAIIGDNVDAALAKLQPGTASTLVPIHCEGFKSQVCASGYDAAFIAIREYMLPKEALPKEKGLVNLFAPTSVSLSDQIAIENMLGHIGARANYIPFYSSPEKIREITSAEVSTSICKVFADEFMKELEEVYGIPFAHTVMPIGVRNTDIWYAGIAKLLGKEKEAQEYIDREHARVLPLLAEVRERLQGKTVFVLGGTGRSFAAAALIDDFGMKLAGLQIPIYDSDAQDDIEYLNGVHGEYITDVSFRQPFELINVIRKARPDVIIGPPSWSTKLDIPSVTILDAKRPTMGYDGILYLGNKIADQINNPGFTLKLAQYARLPYRESWYETNPYKFIQSYKKEETPCQK